jgi:hypothetical protein
MDMDLAVAKLNLAGVAMSRRKLEATNFLNEARKIRQTEYADRPDKNDERSNEENII